MVLQGCERALQLHLKLEPPMYAIFAEGFLILYSMHKCLIYPVSQLMQMLFIHPQELNLQVKGIAQPKITILPLFTQPHVIANLCAVIIFLWRTKVKEFVVKN